jgi:hypothetical protein
VGKGAKDHLHFISLLTLLSLCFAKVVLASSSHSGGGTTWSHALKEKTSAGFVRYRDPNGARRRVSIEAVGGAEDGGVESAMGADGGVVVAAGGNTADAAGDVCPFWSIMTE